MSTTIIDQLRRFANDELDASEFETWVYDTDDLEAFLGEARYQRLISADYRDGFVLLALRPEVGTWIDELAKKA
ncbi:MAG TPA: hypothetical protein VGQ83_00470 [Polyangia bacterium]|jgi:hypothetical protein